MLTSVKKKDHIQFIINSKNSSDLTLEIFSKGDSFVSETTSIKMQHVQNMKIEDFPDEYETSIITPSSEFLKMAKGMKKYGSVINVYGRKRQTQFSSNSSGVIARDFKFGEVDDTDIEYSKSFNAQQILNTSKLANISDRIRIKYKDGCPLCLEGTVGPLGPISIFIKSQDMISKKN
jgi:hypothetical protein